MPTLTPQDFVSKWKRVTAIYYMGNKKVAGRQVEGGNPTASNFNSSMISIRLPSTINLTPLINQLERHLFFVL